MNENDLPERFAQKVDFHPGTDCWLWHGSTDGWGYGLYGHSGRNIRAHRYAYESLVGPIPPGKLLDHSCFNRACVNPSHLRPVTTKENAEHRSGPNKKNSSGVRGVHWYNRDGVWRVSIGHNGRTVHGGYFTDLSEAEKAANELRARIFSNLSEESRS